MENFAALKKEGIRWCSMAQSKGFTGDVQQGAVAGERGTDCLRGHKVSVRDVSAVFEQADYFGRGIMPNYGREIIIRVILLLNRFVNILTQ